MNERELAARVQALSSPASVTISAAQQAQMQAVIAAVETVVAQPGWLAETAGQRPGAAARGVFFGYDFHLNAGGVHLIEINTNAGGALIHAAQLAGAAASLPEGLAAEMAAMFRQEWRRERGDAPLRTLAIVDEQPESQFLYADFCLAQRLFQAQGWQALIVDPAQLSLRADGVYAGAVRVDLIYNRLTDFSLRSQPALAAAWRQGQVVLTPHPDAYARYADKRNLIRLTDAGLLRQLKVADALIATLQAGIPATRPVVAEAAQDWWAQRRDWFFKPESGYGSKGAYRGDKLTRRVFDEIMQGGYVAQRLAPPGECAVRLESGEQVQMKFDLRCYVYDGRIQLMAARLYQGQTTNFRTPGGGFAPVIVEESR